MSDIAVGFIMGFIATMFVVIVSVGSMQIQCEAESKKDCHIMAVVKEVK